MTRPETQLSNWKAASVEPAVAGFGYMVRVAVYRCGGVTKKKRLQLQELDKGGQ